MRLIIAGSRWIPETVSLLAIDEAITPYLPRLTMVLCGKARGPDTAGETWATQRNIRVGYYPALWHTYGKRAGPERNERMAVDGTHLLALHDGVSTGTNDMIARATARYGAPRVMVLRIEPSLATQARLDAERRERERVKRVERKARGDLAAGAPAT